MIPNFKCNQCGNCCKNYSKATIEKKDILKWINKDKKNILTHIIPIDPYGDWAWIKNNKMFWSWKRFQKEEIQNGARSFQGWFEPKSKKELIKCPWLQKINTKKYICQIEDVKPITCSNFPETNANAIYRGCTIPKCITLKDFWPKQKKPKISSTWTSKVEEWDSIAEKLNYKTITEMLYDLYENKEMSFVSMEKPIGFSRETIKKKLKLLGIIRNRGGANNPWGVKRKPENRI